MGEKMKLIIDIPDRIYKINQNRTLNITDAGILEKAVRNSTPLDDLKAEIADLPTDMFEVYKLKSRVLYMLDNIGKDKGGE
jgi:hypothetical protein